MFDIYKSLPEDLYASTKEPTACSVPTACVNAGRCMGNHNCTGLELAKAHPAVALLKQTAPKPGWICPECREKNPVSAPFCTFCKDGK